MAGAVIPRPSQLRIASLLGVVLALATASSVSAQSNGLNQLETPRLAERDQRKEFTLVGDQTAFKFKFAAATGPAMVNNAAALQLQVDKIGNKFLSTLPYPGSAQFLTVMKPCSILLPHVHQRASEFYSVLFGKMSAGIAQENGALQNITFTVNPGEVFVVPQGLLHFNHNQQCFANAFFQSFNSADPGALSVTNALAALGASGKDGAAAILASTAAGVKASAFGAFALDAACLKRCKLPATGAPGDGLQTLPSAIRALFKLTAAGVKASAFGAFALDAARLKKRCELPATGAPGDGLQTLSSAPRALVKLSVRQPLQSLEA